MSRITEDAREQAAAVQVLHESGGRVIDVAAILQSPPPADVSLLAYRVPTETEDGTCSLPDKLAATPFNTRAVLQCSCLPPSGQPAGLPEAADVRRAAGLRGVCEAIAAATGSEWVGVYERLAVGSAFGGGEALLKLAYVGSPSRALFPLTPAFAALSNNSTVGMSGCAVVIDDAGSMDSDTPYYKCDGRVLSEYCAPIVSREGIILGIVDAEAWRSGVYTAAARGLILDACAQLGASSIGRAAPAH